MSRKTAEYLIDFGLAAVISVICIHVIRLLKRNRGGRDERNGVCGRLVFRNSSKGSTEEASVLEIVLGEFAAAIDFRKQQKEATNGLSLLPRRGTGSTYPRAEDR